MNQSPKIVFEHDANNDYFSRNTRPAKLKISIYDKKKRSYIKKPALIKSRSTNYGITNLRIQPLLTSKIGDKLTVQIELIDKKFSDEPVVFKGKIRFLKKFTSTTKGCQCECHQSGSLKCAKCEMNHSTKSSTKAKNTAREKKESKNENERESEMSLPQVIPVNEGDENWISKSFTKYTGIKITVGSGFLIYVNKANESLKRELESNKNEAQLILKLYQTAWKFLAAAMYHRMDQEKSKNSIDSNQENESTIEDKIAEASNGIAMVLIPILTKLAPQAKKQISNNLEE
jgi:hypothetical protein